MNRHHCFLVEVGTEELPPKALRTLMAAFSNGVRGGLESAALACEGVTGFASPRRLAVKVTGLADRQRDQESEHRGPPVRIAFDKQGAPTRAATGFADSHGVKVDDLERVHTDKGDWLFYRSKSKGASAAALLPSVVEKALDKLPIPRRMRWGDSEVEFVRPVHWIVMLLDKEVLPATLFNIPAGRETFGHRVHAPGPFSLKSAADYPDVLARRGHVLADFEARRKAVLEELGSAAMAAAGTPVMDNALLDEVTALVEWPVAVSGSIPEGFLALPDEVLVATLQEHQRYFPLRDGTGALMPAFVAISNLESTRPEKVREGNERVVRPRLADAEFFFSSDRKTPLEKRFDELDGILFHKKLGSLGEKTRRVTALAGELAQACGADRPLTQRAAHLSRCDLVTDMVGEFPELQGTMGRHYAAADGEAPEVSAAIQELYLPRFAGDALPETPAGRALSIADKIDTLVGIFAIGRPPTGTRDPFGLRRAALGVLRITIEQELDVDLEPLLAHAEQQLPGALLDSRVSEDVLDYMLERLRAYYLDNPDIPGVTPEMFDAVSAARPTRPIDFHRRIVAVRDFMGLEAAVSLASANKRIANILKKAGRGWPETSDPGLFEEEAERGLYMAMIQLADHVHTYIEEGQYASALTRLAELRAPVDQFFDSVLVMADDQKLRNNRLALLHTLHRLFSRTADFSRLSPS